ncbi:putative glycolipid-binding domain-containing protein [Actinomadura alba]|uniref:Glycolipid-binding domain-containing protein n=1 Tax=Actinomadura alba TaxID=406431 RepID=A0ABR7LGF9_9ACTN|nr:putative glycolipid-binding domain-containing protein [Actinomadura alba]MBC6463922.1 putative glycolipid-binding domain-containing protein [Actinomadura alba]
MQTSLVWMKPEGAEIAEIELSGTVLSAAGTAIGTDPLPYRLDYELTTGEDYVTSRLLVQAGGVDPATGPWRRTLELTQAPRGVWTVHAKAEGHVALPPPGGDADVLEGALDCDLGLSPLTNTMPVLRHRLLDGPGPDTGGVDFLMAWVSVPDLVVTPSPQTYRHVRRDPHPVVNFSDGDFTADIVFDRDGFILDYPEIGRRA